MNVSRLKRISAFMIALAALIPLASACTLLSGTDTGGDRTADPAASAPEVTPEPTDAPEVTQEPTPTPVPTPTAEPTPTPTPEPIKATLMFVGDLMCLASQQYSAQKYASGGSRYDFKSSFEYVKPILEQADCAFGNLETTLSHSWPYATALQRTDDNMPNCNGPKEYLEAVKYAGFDVLALANNHCCDAGQKGILETLDAVDEYGFMSTGVFRTAEDKRFIIVDVKGIRIAVLSYAESYNGKNGCVYGKTYMINTFSEEKVKRDVAAARAEGAELVIAYAHWGFEHLNAPPQHVREHAVIYANAGVDIICGSHSHSVQPTVWITADDGRKVLCMYSMGNFVSSMSRDTARDTFIAEVWIEKPYGENARVTKEIYHTCRIISELNGKNFVVVPTDERSLPGIANALAAADERIRKIIFAERGR